MRNGGDHPRKISGRSLLTQALSTWKLRLGRTATGLTVLAVIAGAAGLTLARYDVIGKLAGFTTFLAGGLAAALAALCGIVALLGGVRTGRLAGAVLIALAYAGFLLSRPMSAGDIPAIHDITTDLADPPAFSTLKLRADNLAGVETLDNWKRIHAAAYGDIKSVTIPQPVPVVAERALKLAQQAGWEIVSSDVAAGRIEATASVSYIRFKDDVVIRITPSADGKDSRVDMRSVSRVGISDLGVNARRIRDFLAALTAA